MIVPLSQGRGTTNPSVEARIPFMSHFRVAQPVSFVEKKIKPRLPNLPV
jgi:hypothetical protein